MTIKRPGPGKDFRLDRLLEATGSAGELVILPHNDPDPDAIASAVGLRHLLVEMLNLKVSIAYRGIIGRAENKALVQFLNDPLVPLVSSKIAGSAPIALVDTQPGAGNNPLLSGIDPVIVLDHHPLREETAFARFADVRVELGSTSTILTEYHQSAGIPIDAPLATALFYGIKTDTLGLVRGASPADVAAYFHLQTLIDANALAAIERAQVPLEYFSQLSTALHSAQIFDNIVICHIGQMRRPDMAAELADLLLRLEGIEWVICTGVFNDVLALAIRTRSSKGGAGMLAQKVVGDRGTAGGHGAMAGGQIRVESDDPDQLALLLRMRVLEQLGKSTEIKGQPLV
ncbi:MAG: DHH family phosphoesterase [Anaerolineales bacterium]|nr:DHH family phosphoesterase [Anaerolineales bacterium]